MLRPSESGTEGNGIEGAGSFDNYTTRGLISMSTRDMFSAMSVSTAAIAAPISWRSSLSHSRSRRRTGPGLALAPDRLGFRLSTEHHWCLCQDGKGVFILQEANVPERYKNRSCRVFGQ